MLEIVPQAMHKGHVVKKALSEALSGEPPDFVLCVGDLLSDEKMFSSVYSYLADAPRAPLDRAFTVAVGRKASAGFVLFGRRRARRRCRCARGRARRKIHRMLGSR